LLEKHHLKIILFISWQVVRIEKAVTKTPKYGEQEDKK